MCINIEKGYEKAMKKIDAYSASNVINKHLVADSVKKRASNVHKGNCGRLFICAGSQGMTGAATLCTLSAMRCGCGLVTLGCAEELGAVFEIKLTEAIKIFLPSHGGVVTYDAKDIIASNLEKSTAFLMGPGLSQSNDLRSLVSCLIKVSKVPMVLDADAINAIAGNASVLKEAQAPVIITPHIGEFARLIGKDTGFVLENKESLAVEFAKEYGCVVVLKSHQTVVALANGEIYANALGNPGMAKGGSGDVLSGAIASFLAQGCSARLASLAGVYFHSLAGDIAAHQTGEYSLLAGDIINCLMYALKQTQEDLNFC